MKFAFALLPIAAVLRFVVAGPVFAGDLVCALMLSSQIYRTHYQLVVDQACPCPSNKPRLRWRLLQVHCNFGNALQFFDVSRVNCEGRIMAMAYGLLSGARPCSI